MAKIITLLTILALVTCLRANDTLFVQKSFSHNISYRDDASELYRYFDISKSVVNVVGSLFPEKNIGEKGTFFYTSYRKNGFFVYKYAYFSFEDDSLYFAIDPSEHSAEPSSSTRIGNCMKQHFLQNFERYRSACAKAFPLKPKLREWIELLKKNYSDIMSAGRGDDVYVLVFEHSGNEKVFTIPDFSKIKREFQSVILDYYKEVYLLFSEFANYEFPQCWWDKLVDNPEHFAIRSNDAKIKEIRCSDL
ncbi:MAG: hypothetical protein IKH55_03935 [Fibrobacter sp.]|jgi:hypothetical protein|nr:hypothetical protein [Fibrobacter sp.]